MGFIIPKLFELALECPYNETGSGGGKSTFITLMSSEPCKFDKSSS